MASERFFDKLLDLILDIKTSSSLGQNLALTVTLSDNSSINDDDNKASGYSAVVIAEPLLQEI